MNSLDIMIPMSGKHTMQKNYPFTITYNYYDGGFPRSYEVKLLLLDGALLGDGPLLEVYSRYDGGSVDPVIKKEESSPISLMEQVSKLPFKEQNALYKLMNTWGCRMERA